MTAYDPFARGPHPVGVVTRELHDPARGRTLPVEIWYPAGEAHRGQDRDDATRDRFRTLPFAPEVTQDAVRDVPLRPGRRPLVIFSHGFGGARRQTTHLCTHWASHGYAVAAMDHVGNTTQDMLQMAMPGAAPADPGALIGRFIVDRPADVSFVIDRMLVGDGGVEIDPARIGVAGHSFGGWTTLMSVARDERVRAALPLAPAGGKTPLMPGGAGDEIAGALSLEWTRRVPTLYLVAEFDTLLPLDGMRELIARTPAPCGAVLLCDADHFHFCDRVEATHDLFKTMSGLLAVGDERTREQVQSLVSGMKSSAELCPGDDAYALLQGLGLAHMDAHLAHAPEARAFLAQDLESVMSARGVKVRVLREPPSAS